MQKQIQPILEEEKFEQAAAGIYEPLFQILKKVPLSLKKKTQEIRLRAGQPLCLSDGRDTYFITTDGTLCTEDLSNSYRVTQRDIEMSFRKICDYSVYSRQQEIRNGFITLQGGHRAGLCGTAVLENGELSGIRNISSINIRVAKEMIGAADELVRQVFVGNRPCSLLIAGPPCSGKTTVLRDLALQISDGRLGRYYKSCIIDERGEIAAMQNGLPQNKIGVCSEVMSGYKKGEAMQIALRCLSPDFIICDEIGSHQDVQAIEESINAGVGFIATVHSSNMDELVKRPQITQILQTGVFEKIVFLKNAACPGQIAEIITWGGKESNDKTVRNGSGSCMLVGNRDYTGE